MSASLILFIITFYNDQDPQASLSKVDLLHYSDCPSITTHHLFPTDTGMLSVKVLWCTWGQLEHRAGGTRAACQEAQPEEEVSNLKLSGQFPSIKMGNPESTRETTDS